MPGFLQFLGAVIGVFGVLAALVALLVPGFGIPMAVGIAISSLSLGGLLAGIAGIALRIDEQTRVSRAIFSAIDELWLKPHEATLRAAGDADAAKRALDTRQTGTPYGTQAQPVPAGVAAATAKNAAEPEPSAGLEEARARLKRLRAAREGRYPTDEEEQAQADVARLEMGQERHQKPLTENT